MKCGIIEGFEMHRTKTRFGLSTTGDRTALMSKAGDLGFQGVELGIGQDYEQDELWTGEGDLRRAIRNASETSGVDVTSICLHMLNDQQNSPASSDAEQRAKGRAIIVNAIEICSEVRIPVILVPFFGSASLREEENIQHLIESMKELAPLAAAAGVCLALETSLGAPDTIRIIDAIGSDNVKVYFDTGNADIIGYDVIDEIEALGSRIVQVHIKDNPAGLLGMGQIDFENIYKALDAIGYDGYLVLETPALENASISASKNLGYIEGIDINFKIYVPALLHALLEGALEVSEALLVLA